MVIETDFSRLSKGEIGLTIADGKSLFALLQQLVVEQQCEAYVLTSRICGDCQTFRCVKDCSWITLSRYFWRWRISLMAQRLR